MDRNFTIYQENSELVRKFRSMVSEKKDCYYKGLCAAFVELTRYDGKATSSRKKAGTYYNMRVRNVILLGKNAEDGKYKVSVKIVPAESEILEEMADILSFQVTVLDLVKPETDYREWTCGENAILIQRQFVPARDSEDAVLRKEDGFEKEFLLATV